MSLHMKLKFAKMTIRTKALEIMARRNKQQSLALDELNCEIRRNTALLAIYTDVDSQQILTESLERDKAEVERVLQVQRKVLVQKRTPHRGASWKHCFVG
jgi:hypothetical protein